MAKSLALLALLIAFAENVAATHGNGLADSFFSDMVVLRDSTSARV